MKNNKLAIAIPTYNRALILKENLLLMLEEVRQYSIPIYISDDSVNRDTEIMIEKIKYEYIYYYKNIPSLGHDKNCLTTIGLPTEDYVWYLGDSIVIKPYGIEKVLSVIMNNNYDFVSVSIERRKLDLSDRLFTDANKLLVDLGWHLTLTGATIYSKSIQNLFEELDLYKCKNFPQVAMIFEKFSKEECNLFWINDKIIYSNKNKKSYWNSNVFEVFLKDWDSLITNLSNFYLEQNKRYAIKKHSEMSGLFSYKNFLSYRSNGFFSFSILMKYYKAIRFNSNCNIVLLVFISVLPKGFLILIKKFLFKEKIKNYLN